MNPFATIAFLVFSTGLFFLSGLGAAGAVVINEIHYHPVERPEFDAEGGPLLDLSKDVHEFIELHNAGSAEVTLDGWRLSGGIAFTFPSGTLLPAGGFAVVARDPARLASIEAYGLAPEQILGPYSGQLGNEGDAVRLRDALGNLVDSVSYSSAFPWAIAANALGAEDEWTGLDSYQFQYRGRSLERVSVTHAANDPANWLASPLPGDPSPGRANAVTRTTPRPVVIELRAVQNSDGAVLIRSNQPVRVECTFSATNELGDVAVEYFVDDINSTTEIRTNVVMASVGKSEEGKFAGLLPGQLSRRLVRYRIVADRGAGPETVSPRADDPYGWHAYFVTPVRTSPNPIYDCFISSRSLTILTTNISQSPRRVVLPDPPGRVRTSWNATQPAVLIYNGEVFDIQMRYHGSRYSRGPGRNSFKWQFPRYHRFSEGRGSLFITDKGDEHRIGSQFYDAANFPTWRCRYINLFLNGASSQSRLQQEELEEATYRRWAQEQANRFPGLGVEDLGGIYKATGVIPFETAVGQNATAVYTNSGEGPYYIGNCALPPAKLGWSTRQRCEWTYGPQINGWKGGVEVETLLRGLWAARGDSPTAPRANLPAVRAFLENHFDVDMTLTYMAIRDWSGPFDNATHNYFLWQRADGRWAMLPWDLDSEFDNPPQTIFWDEQATVQPDPLRGPHWIKDSFYKAFRDEYKQRLWLVNNTLLNPTNFAANGWTPLVGFANQRFPNVNQQLGLGVFHRPLRPVHSLPLNGSNAVAPSAFQVSAYAHSRVASPAAHASTTWLIRRSDGGFTNPVARVTSTIHLTSWPIPFAQLEFGRTYFWKCFFTDAEGHPSLESLPTSFVYGIPSEPGPVRLNEILADNDGTTVNGPTAPDFIELINSSDVPQTLDNFSLSDNPERPGKFVFPAGTVLAGQGMLVVWCDRATNAPGLHTGFALDNDGQTVVLFSFGGGGYRLADTMTYGLQVRGRSVGKVGDSWVLNTPTPGTSNEAATFGSAAALKINEWMASSTTGPDWFELYNSGSLPVALGGLYLSDSALNLTNTRVAPLSFVAAQGHRRFFADPDATPNARQTNFRLSAGGESILVCDSNLTVLDSISFGAQLSDVAQGRLPDGTGPIVSFPGSASPDAPNHLAITEVVINEVLPSLELRNVGTAPVTIGGWWVSDDPFVLEKYQVPAGITLPPGGYWGIGNDQLPFAFDLERGGRVLLSHGAYRVSAEFDPWDGHSQGTVSTSVGVDFTRLLNPSFGSVNGAPYVGPVVISEIQYHPPELPGDDDAYEYIELANLGVDPTPLHAAGQPELPWRLRDAVSFTFPPRTILASGGRILVVSFDPATNQVALSNFLAAYDVPAETVLFGPFEGHLNNDGDSVELVEDRPALTRPGRDYGLVPTLLLERVRYRDATPWPSAADGSGASLQRQQLHAYGNEPANWFAAGLSPGAASRSNSPPTVALIAPLSGSSFNAAQSIRLEVDARDPDGFVRLVEYFIDGSKIGEASSAPFTLNWSNATLGAHLLMARARDNQLGVNFSAPISVTFTNDPPRVLLTGPIAGSSFVLPTNIVLEATASDSDGTIQRVEFFSDGLRLGEDTSVPFQFVWTNAGAGSHSLSARAIDDRLTTSASAPVGISATRLRNIAYVVPVGSVGGQSFGGALGMDFEVRRPIVVTALGVFDSGADGLAGSAPLTAQIFARNGNSGAMLRSLTFNGANPGTLTESSRFKPLPAPLVLSNGSYTIVGSGHNGDNPNGNLCCGPKTWRTEDGGGLIEFVGSSRYQNTPNVFPTTIDEGPVDRYAAGTFEFVPVPAAATIFGQPTNLFIRPGLHATNRVVAAGQEPLFYQWYFNGGRVPEATNASFVVTNLTIEGQGGYSVIVSNALATATSQVATLTLLIDPVVVESPLSQTVVPGESVTLSVVVTNTATLPIGYRWRTNNVFIGGAFTVLTQRVAFFTIPDARPPFTNYSVLVTNLARTSGLPSGAAILTFAADSDQDGLPDVWEQTYFGNLSGTLDGDSDLDGFSNGQEYRAGTDPTDPTSYLRVDTLTVNGAATAALTFVAQPSRTYSVEFREAWEKGDWSRLAEIPAGPETRMESVVDPQYHTNRFYRLRTPR